MTGSPAVMLVNAVAKPVDGRRAGAGRQYAASILISFDIDGTLECGDPPGPIALEAMRQAKARGYVVGSGSDRVRSDQQRLWDIHEIDVDFVGGKHHLDEVRDQFEATRYIHIGDTDVDRYYAEAAGFEFLHVEDLDGVSGALAGTEFFDWLG